MSINRSIARVLAAFSIALSFCCLASGQSERQAPHHFGIQATNLS